MSKISLTTHHVEDLSKCYPNMHSNVASVVQEGSDLFIIVLQKIV